MHEIGRVNHWWLLVVNLIDQVGEIFDSAPDPTRSGHREQYAKTVVSV
jgi:hypothetical protein